MNYRSMSNLSNIIIDKINELPNDIDLIVGVPRSGLLVANIIALLLNKPFTDFEGLFEKRMIASGKTKNISQNASRVEECKKILLVEDSVGKGKSIQACKDRIREAKLSYDIVYFAVYVSPETKKMVDIYFEELTMPRLFEWNLFHNKTILEKACFDLDGVLCADPTKEENDDGEKYSAFLQRANTKILPSCKIGYIVTSRLEKYRKETEEWLKRNGVVYGQLIMFDGTAEERKRYNLHASYKASHYIKTNSILFVESSMRQAIEINELTKKPVYCVETNLLLDGSKKYELKYESGIKIKRLLSRSKTLRKVYHKIKGN